MRFVIPQPAPASLPVAGEEGRFPLRRVYCVGRNYADHAREMGHDPDREPPFFFQKNPDDLDTSGRFPYPPLSADVHHEVELLVALKQGGENIAPDRALACVYGYGIAIDMTRRDLQAAAKKAGRPWIAAKAFAGSGPCGPIHPAATAGHPAEGRIWLEVNGEARQDGDLAQMIWKVPEIITELSRLFVLAPGDVVLTGTPAGVGPVRVGDVMTTGIASLGEVRVEVATR